MDLFAYSILERGRGSKSAPGQSTGEKLCLPSNSSTLPRRAVPLSRHWSGSWAVLFLLAAGGAELLPAAENQPLPQPAALEVAQAGASLSAKASRKRAVWQDRFTLGPGDTLNLVLLNPDMPETARTEVPVGPDGRITFLQARDVMASGLTVDELRAKLDEALGKFYQNARTTVMPVEYRSKKYIMLGAVATRGVFTFDRPVTVIEALARAGGLETGLYEQRTVELADLSHSFLLRQGKRVPVDFERLFQRGDLSQNAALEPDDYLYFASASANEIYVLGEVALPGVVGFAPKATAISAIASRGGFTTRAFKGRVLVVRGSLNQPKTFVIDTAAILKGKQQDFLLQPRDIVYVSQNPWVIAAEVVDLAARAFIQGVTVEATTLNLSPVFRNFHIFKPPAGSQ